LTATQDRARRPRGDLVASWTRSAPRPIEALALGGELGDVVDNLADRDPPARQ
jgi:hypothetical protein